MIKKKYMNLFLHLLSQDLVAWTGSDNTESNILLLNLLPEKLKLSLRFYHKIILPKTVPVNVVTTLCCLQQLDTITKYWNPLIEINCLKQSDSFSQDWWNWPSETGEWLRSWNCPCEGNRWDWNRFVGSWDSPWHWCRCVNEISWNFLWNYHKYTNRCNYLQNFFRTTAYFFIVLSHSLHFFKTYSIFLYLFTFTNGFRWYLYSFHKFSL